MSIMINLDTSNRFLRVIDNAIPERIMHQWSEGVLNNEHRRQDIGHDFMSSQTVIENEVVPHDIKSTSQLDQDVRDLTVRHIKEVVYTDLCDISAWYTNIITLDSQGWVHRDSSAPPNCTFTSLWFPHGEWHINWGGETLFYCIDTSDVAFFNKALKINSGSNELRDMLEECHITAVVPKPNRMIIFDSSLLHSARPPQRDVTRLSTALKVRI